MEFQSAKLYCEVLEKEGFTVETPVAGIQTAFKASYGSGKPVIGILAEFDALSGLSQEAGAAERRELVPRRQRPRLRPTICWGAGLAGGCLRRQKNIWRTAIPAPSIFLRLPRRGGRRGQGLHGPRPHLGGAGRRADLASGQRPTRVTSGTCNTCIQTEYKFTGIASHASGSPELGRSALDAVELMNVRRAVFARAHAAVGPHPLRHHRCGRQLPRTSCSRTRRCCIWSARCWPRDAPGPCRSGWDKIAQGAAMMTETTVKKRFIDGCSNTVPNKTLETLFWKKL